MEKVLYASVVGSLMYAMVWCLLTAFCGFRSIVRDKNITKVVALSLGVLLVI